MDRLYADARERVRHRRRRHRRRIADLMRPDHRAAACCAGEPTTTEGSVTARRPTGADAGRAVRPAASRTSPPAGATRARSHAEGRPSAGEPTPYGQLGDGTTTHRSTPTPVIGLASNVAAVATGGGHSCALTTDGAVKCWGYNYYGQVGDNTQTDRPFPATTVVGLAGNVVAIAAGVLPHLRGDNGRGHRMLGRRHLRPTRGRRVTARSQRPTQVSGADQRRGIDLGRRQPYVRRGVGRREVLGLQRPTARSAMAPPTTRYAPSAADWTWAMAS